MVLDKGKVFGWGNSEYGQLFVQGDNQQVNIATELNALQQLGHIKDIASGGCFCMVLNSKFLCNNFIFNCVHNYCGYAYCIDDGDVYVWGYGILGFGPKVTRIMQPTPIPSVLFGRNAYEKDTKVS